MAKRTVGRLTARHVTNSRKHFLADGGGLYLQTSFGADGEARRSWVFRYERGGRRREMGLGPLHTRGLKEARAEARRLRELLLQGLDPLEHRRKAVEARAVEAGRDKTFAQVAGAYLRAHRADWKNAKHAKQWERSLTVETAAIANLPVAAIDTAHVLGVLEPIWRVKPESASRLRGRIERVLAYAVAAKYRKRELGNPASWSGHLQELLGSKSKAQQAKRERTQKSGHHPAVPYREVGAFMTALRRRNSLSARGLEFTVLTSARTGETLGATWPEIDLSGKVWTIPASRMKGGREHRVPLCERALEILQGLRGHKSRLFPLSSMAMLECLRALRPDVTVHGFRATFMDWAHERTAFPKVVIDMALAHAVGDKVEASYRRGDLFEKRRTLMGAWGRHPSFSLLSNKFEHAIGRLRDRRIT